uniref:Uncharacterized protein n=1 Tax=Rhizophora mucronata TaxID=61149 RepID=A0A2P2N460_RHIMU
MGINTRVVDQNLNSTSHQRGNPLT